jgi:hypothetical protein
VTAGRVDFDAWARCRIRVRKTGALAGVEFSGTVADPDSTWGQSRKEKRGAVLLGSDFCDSRAVNFALLGNGTLFLI